MPTNSDFARNTADLLARPGATTSLARVHDISWRLLYRLAAWNNDLQFHCRRVLQSSIIAPFLIGTLFVGFLAGASAGLVYNVRRR